MPFLISKDQFPEALLRKRMSNRVITYTKVKMYRFYSTILSAQYNWLKVLMLKNFFKKKPYVNKQLWGG